MGRNPNCILCGQTLPAWVEGYCTSCSEEVLQWAKDNDVNPRLPLEEIFRDIRLARSRRAAKKLDEELSAQEDAVTSGAKNCESCGYLLSECGRVPVGGYNAPVQTCWVSS